jgi:hypothetical protein
MLSRPENGFLAIRKICAILLLKRLLFFAKRVIFGVKRGKGIPGSVLGQNPGGCCIIGAGRKMSNYLISSEVVQT